MPAHAPRPEPASVEHHLAHALVRARMANLDVGRDVSAVVDVSHPERGVAPRVEVDHARDPEAGTGQTASGQGIA